MTSKISKVRWGLLSTAHINQRLIPAIRASRRAELMAVASRDLNAAEAYAQKWSIPHPYGSYQAMLDSDLIDAVYISLPNHLHAEWTFRSLQSGKHVLCEKPFAITLDEVDQMITASRQTGRVLAEAFMYRHHPQTKILGEAIKNGLIGDISLVISYFNFTLSERENVRMMPEFGGGSLWDIGVYPISLAQFVYGCAPHSVMGYQYLGETGIDETFIGQMVYPDGGLAQISSSFRTHFQIHAEIIGTTGRLVLTRPFTAMDRNRRMIYYPDEGKVNEIHVPRQELYRGEVEDFNSAILDGSPTYISLQETRSHIRTVLALYESAINHQAVTID